MKVTVTQNTPVVASVRGSAANPLTATVIPTGPAGPQGEEGPPGPAGSSLNLISAALDVDVTGITDGALLIFSEAESKWVAGTTLEDQYIEGGHF